MRTQTRLIFLIAILFFGNSNALPGQTASSLLDNSGFEKGKEAPDSWTSKTSNDSKAIWQIGSARKGNRCLSLEGTHADGLASWSSAQIPIKMGYRYIISAWCKTKDVGEKRGWIWISTFDKDHKWKKDYFLTKATGAQDWFRISRSFIPVEEEEYAVVNLKLHGTGKMWVDDVKWVPSQTIVNDHRILLIQDRPFFPMGVYVGTASPQIFPDLKKAGFNSVLSYSLAYQDVESMKSYLDRAQETDLKVAISFKDYMTPYRLSEPQVWLPKEKVIRCMDAVRSHPALLTWYVADEPSCQGVSLDDALGTYVWINHLDGDHPISTCLCDARTLGYYVRATDVIMPDIYPVPLQPLAEITDVMKRVKQVSSSRQPIWAVIQAFDPSYYSDPKEKLRPPTFDEIRCMTWQAIVHGATGLFYYCYQDSSYKIYEHPETWLALQKVVAEVNELIPALVADPVSINVYVSPEDSVDLLVAKAHGIRYLIAVNKDPYAKENVHFKSSLFQDVNSVKVKRESRLVPVSSKEIIDDFSSYGVHIYQIKKETKK